MRLVRLKLRGCPFWVLPPIELSQIKDVSPLLDVDLLSDAQRDVINKSVRVGEIRLVDQTGEFVDGTLEAVNIIEGNFVSADDIDDEEDVIPEIVSVTADNDEEDEEDGEEEDEGEGQREEVLAEARLLLGRNGNTVKKALLALEQSDYNLHLLHACMMVEEDGKNRSGVIQTIRNAISEY